MKKIFTTFAFALAIMSAEAKCLIFTLENGSLIYYQLGGDANPVMRFDGDKATVNTDTYEIADIKNFYISNEDAPEEVGIKKVDDAIPVPRFANDSFTIKAKDDDKIKVYTANGTEVEVGLTKTDGYVQVDLSKLKRGVYIVKVGGEGFKITKR